MMLHTTVGLHWTSSPPPDKFPGLGFEGDRGRGRYRDKRPYQDPRTRPQTGFLCSIDPKFVGKLLFNILLFARNSNTNRVSSSNFPL